MIAVAGSLGSVVMWPTYIIGHFLSCLGIGILMVVISTSRWLWTRPHGAWATSLPPKLVTLSFLALLDTRTDPDKLTSGYYIWYALLLENNYFDLWLRHGVKLPFIGEPSGNCRWQKRATNHSARHVSAALSRTRHRSDVDGKWYEDTHVRSSSSRRYGKRWVFSLVKVQFMAVH